MIDIYTGELKDLWPDETSPEFLSVSYAIRMHIRRLSKLAGGNGVYWNVDALPESVLDYLAIELRAMYYRQDYDIDRKRIIIKKTLEWHAHAGTVAATEEMLRYLFDGPTRLVEWPDFTEGPFERYTFDIVTEARVTAETYTDLWATLPNVKNARSHLRRIMILREDHDQTTVGAIGVCSLECVCYNATNGNADTTTRICTGSYTGVAPDTVAVNVMRANADTTTQTFVGSYASNDEQDITCINARSDTGETRTGARMAAIARVEREAVVPLGS